MSNGLIDRAFLSGSHDPATYYRKYPRILWKEKGGYEIQSTPQELSAAITQSRAWVKGTRMLAVGTVTFGAERFLAENLGMLDVEYIGEALPNNTESAKKVTKPTGKYDVITVFGTAKVDALLPFTKIGSLVIFIGVGPLAKNPALRASWLAIRKKHMTMLQTGGESWQTGIGVVKIQFVDALPEVPVPDMGVKDGEEKSKPEGQNSLPQDDGANASVPPEGKSGDVRGNADKQEAPVVVKRRGRQPGSKNKVKT